MQLLNQMNAVADNATADQLVLLTLGACADIHNRDEMDPQLRQRVEDDQRRHAEEATRHGHQCIDTQEGNHARLMPETTRTQASTPSLEVASQRDRKNERTQQNYQVL